MNASSWRGWNGSHFSVRFVSPYNDIKPAEHVCTVVNLPAPTNCAVFGMVWSTYLNTFVATLACLSGSMSRSFYFATSDDLIHWSPHQKFYSWSDLPPNVQANVTSMHYPAFLDPTSPTEDDPNFYTIGQTPYIFWTSIGHSPYSDGRSLWATPVKFSKN